MNVGPLFRRESGRLVARLTRQFGVHNLELVEDVVQDTFLRALKQWSIRGLPENPSAWLALTAKRLAIDALRRKVAVETDLESLCVAGETEDERDRLALMFACCDPNLSPESQIALTLQTLGGMSSAEIAGCLSVEPNAVEQRVSRAKKTLRKLSSVAGLPDPSAMLDRSPSVLNVIYQVFAAGYSAHVGDEAVRIDLCSDAFYLIGLLRKLPALDTPPARALNAVMLFCAARIPARTDESGNVVRLQDQDRSQWDPALTARAFRTFASSFSGNEVSVFHLEAAIHAEHAKAETFEATDMRRVLEHYEALVRLAPSPSVRLNHAIALGIAVGPAAGLEALDGGAVQARNPSFHAARARFLTALGRDAEANSALLVAKDLAANGAERDHFSRLLGA